MELYYKQDGGPLHIQPHFRQASWGFLTIELINDRFFSFRSYDLMSHEHVRAVDLPMNADLAAQHFYGVDATFTLNSPDLVSASLQFSQDGVDLGSASLEDSPANGGLSVTLRVHCIARA